MQITGGFLKSRKIDSPKGANVRPTLSQVRESIFSVLFSMTEFDGKKFLDVFAGSGIMGFEAISRGFESAEFIEKDKKTFLLLKSNAEKLGLSKEKSKFHIGDSTKILKKLAADCKASSIESTGGTDIACGGFDVIYVDPPYQSGLYDKVLEIVKNSGLLNVNGIIILEHPKDLEINISGYETIKQKVYADKVLTFLCLG